MVEIEKPRIECIDSQDDVSYGKYIVEPLERGYGTTLGNSLRRILLSSLPGTAATSIKIAGDQFNEAVVKYMRRKHNLLVGERTAERRGGDGAGVVDLAGALGQTARVDRDSVDKAIFRDGADQTVLLCFHIWFLTF